MGESIEHPYSLVRCSDGRTGYVSGVLPYEPDGRSLAAEPKRAVERVLAVLEERLHAAGFRLADVVKTTVFLTDLEWRPIVNEVFYRRFNEPRPARSAVQVSRLPGDAAIELEAVVVREA